MMVGMCKLLVVFTFTWALGKCENVKNLSVDEVAHKLWADLNLQKDGTITEKQLDKEFIRLFDMDGDGEVKKFEFVDKWSSKYHDTKATAELVFDVLDIARDGKLSMLDYEAHFKAADRNESKDLSETEFKWFFTMIHPDTRHHDEL